MAVNEKMRIMFTDKLSKIVAHYENLLTWYIIWIKSSQMKYLFLLQVYFGPINSTLYLRVKK